MLHDSRNVSRAVVSLEGGGHGCQRPVAVRTREQCGGFPGACRDDSRTPVPAVVVPGLEVARKRGIPVLGLFPGRFLENKAQQVRLTVGQRGSEVDAMRHQGAFKAGFLDAVDKDPAGVIQTGRIQNRPFPRRQELRGNPGAEIPVPVLHPFAGKGIQPCVPVGQQPRLEQQLLYGRRNTRGQRADVRGQYGSILHALAEPPREGPPSGQLPVQGRQINMGHGETLLSAQVYHDRAPGSGMEGSGRRLQTSCTDFLRAREYTPRRTSAASVRTVINAPI